MNTVIFENPEWFWAFLLLPLLIWWSYFKRRQRQTEFTYPGAERLATGALNWMERLQWLPLILRSASLTLLIIALARPRTVEQDWKSREKEGIDIVLALDVSYSMMARDLRPDRLAATKEVASVFVENRPNDRIAIVLYSGEAYTSTPLTGDHAVVQNAIEGVDFDILENTGTAIGTGLATAINRVKDSKAKSKVVILLTDGENNAGSIDPITAAKIAQTYGIRVYTIGVGTKGQAMSPVSRDIMGNLQFGMIPVNIDEDLLKEIAKRTDGAYFRATDNNSLQQIYDEIGQMETTKLQEIKYNTYTEKFVPFALWALGLLLLELVLRYTLFKSIV